MEEERVGQGLELALGSLLGPGVGGRRSGCPCTHAVHPCSQQGPAGPQLPRGGRACARGRGQGWALAGGGGLRGVLLCGTPGQKPLRAAEGHCDGLHGLLELPLVRLIVGFVMEAWTWGKGRSPVTVTTSARPSPRWGRTGGILPTGSGARCSWRFGDQSPACPSKCTVCGGAQHTARSWGGLGEQRGGQGRPHRARTLCSTALRVAASPPLAALGLGFPASIAWLVFYLLHHPGLPKRRC